MRSKEEELNRREAVLDKRQQILVDRQARNTRIAASELTFCLQRKGAGEACPELASMQTTTVSQHRGGHAYTRNDEALSSCVPGVVRYGAFDSHLNCKLLLTSRAQALGILFLYNAATLLAVAIATGERIGDFVLSVVYIVFMLPICFLIYRVLYRAGRCVPLASLFILRQVDLLLSYRKSKSSLFVFYFCLFGLEILVKIYFALGIKGCGAGYVNLFVLSSFLPILSFRNL